MSFFSAPHFGPRQTVSALLLLLVVSFTADVYAQGARTQLSIDPIPAEVRSNRFHITLNGNGTDVLHAATGYYLLNFATNGPVSVSVTSSDPHFWDDGVEVQPMRLGIRPVRRGATITFTLKGQQKITITRPGDHFADATMLFLFANAPDTAHIAPTTSGVRYYAPGVHHENIDAHTGDIIYLAPGAVVFGSLNIWQVEDVHVLGTGTIIYDGPQNPHSDEGWMHKPNWHCIVMDNARNIEIDGITCITRSRSWQIQMKDSRHIGFYNIKAIGGNPNDANQDGLDWLGGGETTVRNCFFRASDDVFALQGNWDGYELARMRVPGQDVTNITIEDTIASTSISNTIRVGWPQKTFNSANFRMIDVDVIHMGYGGCKVPFAFFELWADPEGKGMHRNYAFQNIRLEDWYSLFQLRQPLPGIKDVAFSDIWAMDGPGMIPSVSRGDVSGVVLTGATVQGYEDAQPSIELNAAPLQLLPAKIDPQFRYTLGLLRPGRAVHFTANAFATKGRRFEWLFGDGRRAEGREQDHTYSDVDGTLLDSSGRFRVLLHITDLDGTQSWGSQSVVLSRRFRRPAHSEVSNEENKGTEQLFHVPYEGGYTFTLLSSLDASMSVDDLPTHTMPKSRPQVCGSPGNAVQSIRMSAVLAPGDHKLHIKSNPGIENAEFPNGTPASKPLVLWEGPGMLRERLQ